MFKYINSKSKIILIDILIVCEEEALMFCFFIFYINFLLQTFLNFGMAHLIVIEN